MADKASTTGEPPSTRDSKSATAISPATIPNPPSASAQAESRAPTFLQAPPPPPPSASPPASPPASAPPSHVQDSKPPAPPESTTTSQAGNNAVPATDLKPSSLWSSTVIITRTSTSSYTEKGTAIPSTSSISSSTGSTLTASSQVAADGTAAARNGGLRSGAVAGIAMGAAVLGFVLGALAAMLIFRRKGRREEGDSSNSADGGDDFKGTARPPSSWSSSMSPSSAVAALAPAIPPQTRTTEKEALRLQHFLISPTPEQAIILELRALEHLIQQHVENHYHLSQLQLSSADRYKLLGALENLGLGADPSEMPPAQVFALADSPETRYMALRYVIANTAAQNAVLEPGVKFSLLPSSMSSFVAQVAPVEEARGSPRAVAAALTRWRQLSVFLMHPSRSDRNALVPTEVMVGDEAKRLVEALNRFLGAFVDPSAEVSGRQQGHLFDLMMECAKFGCLLMSQPAEFRLRRQQVDGSQDGWGHLVVCPGLEQVADEHGARYSQPIVLLAPTTESV